MLVLRSTGVPSTTDAAALNRKFQRTAVRCKHNPLPRCSPTWWMSD